LAYLIAAFLMLNFNHTMGANNDSSLHNRKARTGRQNIDTLQYAVYKGIIEDKDTKEPLIFATITVDNANIGTISNSDGEFLLKIDKKLSVKTITVSYIGYKNLEVEIRSLKSKKNALKMERESVSLGAINIYPMDPLFLVQSILRKVDENYPVEPNMMKGFYRETIKKNRNYVAISEAVVNIHKRGYKQANNDQIQIYKGRKSENVKKMDTLLFKLQGGPNTSLLMDVIKNPYILLSDDLVGNYDFAIKTITKINDQVHYIIEFKQKPGVELPLYYGLLYVESQSLALTSARFSMNLNDKVEATKIYIRKKPVGVKITLNSANYLVNYREQNGKWYFNYARGEVEFKCNWKRKLFNTNYTAMTEIAITDRDSENVTRFKGSEKFKPNQVLVEKIGQFSDNNFWGAHNTIEPDQSIEAAIRKLKRKGN